MRNGIYLPLLLLCCSNLLLAQTAITGLIKGQLIDNSSGLPIPYSTIKILGTEPILGTVTDDNGEYLIDNVPVGRYSIEFSSLGYEPQLIREILVTSGKDVVLNINMTESSYELDEVIVKSGIKKNQTVNNLAGISARMLSVEEANRYAGGFDDPARLASSFAGVASGLQSNGIVVRGNNPGSLLWRMEGIEISNPNHFADLSSFGGGGLTALSSQMLANSDFLTGAFPSPYSNAISGVFDLNIRNGNKDHRESTIQMGLIGLDVSSEGPFSKNSDASYLFNYRYSTLGLLEPVLPEDAGGTRYQDLSYKFNLPTKKQGLFSVWGIGLKDYSGKTLEENAENWKYESDRESQDINQFMASSGLKHVIYVGNNSFIESDFAYTSNGIELESDKIDSLGGIAPNERINNQNWNYVLQTKFNRKLNEKHTLEFGARSYFQNYNLLLQINSDDSLNTRVDDRGFSILSSFYALSNLEISKKWTLQCGLNLPYFSLNNQFLIEPRLSLEFRPDLKNSIGLAYGLHSRTEKLNYYLNRDENGIQQNKNLKMIRSHHWVMSYEHQLSENLRLKIEPYFQYLFDVPVIPGSSFSFINLQNDWFINQKLENSGTGRNYGIDLTLERYLAKGYYYLLTASIFKSEYKGGDNVWRSSSFDRGYVLNALIGKEWLCGKSKSNMFGINARVSLQGGQKIIPVNISESLSANTIIENTSEAYSQQLDGIVFIHFSASYTINKAKHSSKWSLSVLNATMAEEFQGFAYNYREHSIDKISEPLIIPNLSYKIQF